MEAPEIDKRTLNFKDRSLSEFQKLIKSLKKYSDQIKSEIDEDTKRLRELKILLESLPQVRNYIRKFVGPLREDTFKSKRNKTLKLLAENLLGLKTLEEVLAEKEKIALKSRRDIQLYKGQKEYLKIIPKEIRVFLPDTITIDVDSEGRVKRIGELFANKTYTLTEKLSNQRKLLERYSDISSSLKSGLSSNKEQERISSLISLIILETGIRPGRKGNRILKDEDEIQTFGATTLRRSHVKFLSDGTAQLTFKGKKGATNKAIVRDSDVVSELKRISKSCKGEDCLFKYEDGSDYTYSHLKDFFNKNFEDLKITDFRKLRATEEVFNLLKEERNNLLSKIKSYSDLEAAEAEKKTVAEICKVLTKAHEQAQIALSHDSSRTTKQSYINPEVILHFLSTANLKGSLKDTILKGKTKLHFDPQMFLRQSQRVASSFKFSGEVSGFTLHNMVELLEHII